MSCWFNLWFTQCNNSCSGFCSQEWGWGCHGPFPLRNIMGCKHCHRSGKAKLGQPEQNSAQLSVNVSIPWSHPRKIRVKPLRYNSSFLLMENDHLNSLKIQQKSPDLFIAWSCLFCVWATRAPPHFSQDRRVIKNLNGRRRTGRKFPLACQDVATCSGFAAHDKCECQALRAESQIRQADPQKTVAESENIF